MVNTDEFIKRLELILDYYALNASLFADKIGVQRSSLSHLLSGRNKPSLDFILKIIDVFPEVDLYWILIGKGNFPKSESVSNLTEKIISPILPTNMNVIENKIELQKDLFSESNAPVQEKNSEIKQYLTPNNDVVSIDLTEKEIERIVVFYKNGTFKTYSEE